MRCCACSSVGTDSAAALASRFRLSLRSWRPPLSGWLVRKQPPFDSGDGLLDRSIRRRRKRWVVAELQVFDENRLISCERFLSKRIRRRSEPVRVATPHPRPVRCLRPVLRLQNFDAQRTRQRPLNLNFDRSDNLVHPQARPLSDSSEADRQVMQAKLSALVCPA